MIPSDQRPPGGDWLVRRLDTLERTIREFLSSRRFVPVRDQAGNLVFSDDAAGQGLATPYLAGQFASMSTPTDVNATGTFALLQKAIWRKQHPTMRIWVLTQVTATTAEIRLRISSGPHTDVVIFGPQTLANGTSYAGYGPFTVPGDHMSEFQIDLEGRVASGAGQVAARVLSVAGQQS